jgi:serine/threonine-protein kinase
MRLALRLLPLSSSLLLAASAWAQTPVDARAASVAALTEAKRLAAAGNAGEACAKYGESYSLDAQLDALFPLADCFEQGGKLASAYNAFRDAVEVAQRTGDARASMAEARAQQLRPRLSYLTVEVLRDRRLPALAVERDGFRLGSSAWGVPAPVDPGQHVVSVSAYGYKPWQTTVDVQGEGAAPYVEVPMLEKLPEAPLAPAAPPVVAQPPQPPAPAPAPAPVAAPEQPAPAPESLAATSAGLPPTRVAAIAAAGAGVLSFGFGMYFLSKKSSTLTERDGICPSGKGCEPGTNVRLAELTEQARSQQKAQIAFMAVGGAALALGGVLWFLPKRSLSRERAAYVVPVVQPSGGGFVFGGAL